MIDAFDILYSAVAIPSVSRAEAAVAAFLVSQLQTFCDAAYLDGAGNAVGRLGTGPLQVYVLGHIDTVPGEVPLRLENGRLYGRGSVDAKGPFCTAVAAASRLTPEVLRALTVTLIGAVEEEVPSSRGAHFALSSLPRPDFVIIGEPSGWDAMTLGYKGRLVLRLTRTKDNFHSAGNDSTAAEDVVQAWLELQAWAKDAVSGSGIFESVQLALQRFDTTSDGLTQRAEAEIGLRLPPSCPPERAIPEITERLRAAALTLTFLGQEHPYRGPKDTPLTRAFRVAIRRAGGTPRFKLKTGTSDMNVVAPLWDVPMLAYGPGDSALDHTPNEHVELRELERAVTVLSTALTELALRATRAS